MSSLIRTTFLVLLPAFLVAQSLTQEAVTSGGETFTNGNFSLEWTLGEIMTESYAGSIVITQGIHQPTVNDNSLPVDWLSFGAHAGAKTVDLQWTTSEEPDNAGFHVERSASGFGWMVIGEVAARSGPDQRYAFTDNAPLNGTSYYRLRQTDFDGRVTFSPVETVTFFGKDQVIFYPNPATNVVDISLPEDAEVLDLLEVNGRKVHLRFSGQDGQLTTDVSPLPDGVYFLRIRLKDGRLVTNRLVVH